MPDAYLHKLSVVFDTHWRHHWTGACSPVLDCNPRMLDSPASLASYDSPVYLHR